MKFVVGTRYRWSPLKHGKDKWKNGILSEIFESRGMGKFVTRDNEEWVIALDCESLEEYKG